MGKVPGHFCWSLPEAPVLEAPRPSQTGGFRNLEVPPWYLWRTLGNPAGPPPLAGFQLLPHTNCLLSFSPFVVCLLTQICGLTPKKVFLMILGLTGLSP